MGDSDGEDKKSRDKFRGERPKQHNKRAAPHDDRGGQGGRWVTFRGHAQPALLQRPIHKVGGVVLTAGQTLYTRRGRLPDRSLLN